MADCMRVGILSDTHGSAMAYHAALTAMGEVDLILHAGDYASDARAMEQRTGIPTHAVTGNCDFILEDEEELELTLCGFKILLVHGHEHNIKRNLKKIRKFAEEKGANVCIFGHSHVPLIKRIGHCLYINPGSPYRPRLSIPTCVVLTLRRGEQPHAEIISVFES